MKKPIIFGVVLVVLVSGFGVYWFGLRGEGGILGGPEAEYNGKSVTAWCNDLKSLDSGERSEACEALGALGPKAASAIGDLIEKMEGDKDSRICGAARDALAKIGKPAISSLEQELAEEKSKSTRIMAAFALGEIKDGGEGVPALLKALKDEDREVRINAAEGVGKQGKKAISRATIDGLSGALRDPFPPVRQSCAAILGSYGPEGKGAIGALMEALKDDSPDVAAVAQASLVKIGPAAIAPMIAGLQDKDEKVQTACFHGLGQMGKPAIDPLKEAIRKFKGNSRDMAAKCLRQMSAAALPTFVALLDDKDPEVADVASREIASYGPVALPTIYEMLKDKDAKRHEQANAVLAKIGPEIIPHLKAAIKNADNDPEFVKALEDSIARLKAVKP